MTEKEKLAGHVKASVKASVKEKKHRKNKKRLTNTMTRDGKRLTKTTTIQNINHIKIHVGDKKTKSKTRTRPRGFVKPGAVGGGGNLSHRSMESEHSTNVMNNVYDVRNRAMNNQYMLENLYTNIGTLQNRIDGIGTQVLQRHVPQIMNATHDNNQQINERLYRIERGQDYAIDALTNFQQQSQQNHATQYNQGPVTGISTLSDDYYNTLADEIYEFPAYSAPHQEPSPHESSSSVRMEREDTGDPDLLIEDVHGPDESVVRHDGQNKSRSNHRVAFTGDQLADIADMAYETRTLEPKEVSDYYKNSDLYRRVRDSYQGNEASLKRKIVHVRHSLNRVDY